MERNFYSDDFEQLLKEKADQFRMYPSKRVWHSIYNNLHPSRRWPSAVISILLFFSLVFTGYLNTTDNSAPVRFGGNQNEPDRSSNKQIAKTTEPGNTNNLLPKPSDIGPAYVTAASNESRPEINSLPAAKNDKPVVTAVMQVTNSVNAKPPVNSGNEPVQSVDTYIKAGKVLADAAKSNNKIKINTSSPTASGISPAEEVTGENENVLNTAATETSIAKKNVITPGNSVITDKANTGNENASAKKDIIKADSKLLTPEEKAWIENYAFQNKPSVRNKWKDKLDFEFYVTPAVNYRKLTTNSKGSASLFATGDINRSISQKPGLGVESGLGLSYSVDRNLRFKAGIQFNYTNYNIDADQTNHPVSTTILLNDPNTGYSYLGSRTSTLANSYSSSALQPVVLHNRTYQLSIPVGLAYKLSGKNNVEWFAGASVQPTYVFGGKAHIISSDLKSYISDPSSIRTWNLNLGFETYMSYKLGGYNLQVGPQVRYQVYSTYRRNIALIEKPYAVGLKVGIIKGF